MRHMIGLLCDLSFSHLMNKSYFCILLLCCSFLFGKGALFSDVVSMNQDCKFVSLGSFCWVAQALRSAGLRDEALPFDWLDTSDHEGFIRILNEDFLSFTDPNCFSKVTYRKLYKGSSTMHNYGNSAVLHNYYGAVFSHDWPQERCEYDFKDHLEMIAKKYTRRIERFKNLQNYRGKIFFIRILSVDYNKVGEPGWNSKKAIEVKDTLRQLFPLSNFILVVVSCTDKSVPEINEVDGILEFKIGHLMDMKAYLPMFQTLLNSVK